MEKIWDYAQTYTVKLRKATVEVDDLPVWYISDEFGLRIGHRKEANFKVVPFFYVFQNISYSLLFPLLDVAEKGNLNDQPKQSLEEITRNYVDTRILREHPEWYDVLMHPWKPVDLTAMSVLHKPKGTAYYLVILKANGTLLFRADVNRTSCLP